MDVDRLREIGLRPSRAQSANSLLLEAEAVILDAEGVVLDTEGGWDVAQATFLARRGLRYIRELLKPRLTGLGPRASMKVLSDYYDLPGNLDELIEERRDLFPIYCGEGPRFVNGFKRGFSELQKRGTICLATSMDPKLFDHHDLHLGLSELFRGCVFNITSVGNRSKPAPDLFLYVADRLGIPPQACVVIEDSPSGLAAARAARMSCIGLASTHPVEALAGANSIVRSWDELLSS
jgi:beta-phosphoglucomutase-like phosphatase (HAD superfamily)